ncbi:MAG: radical SAM protein [Micromonosporaceae bacterium]|nr:radical SAM protein [Micromonosporaceae bacterium]
MVRRVWFFQPRTRAKANYANADGAEQVWPPWFAGFLAGAAHAVGLEARLVDARTDPGWQRVVAGLGREDVVAVSVMTGAAIIDAIVASEMVREQGGFVVWGGPHPTLFPEQTLAQSPAHAVVPGFGFAGLRLLLGHLTGAGAPPGRTATVLVKDGCSWRGSLGTPRGRGGVLRAVDVEPDLDLVGDWGPYVNADAAISPRTVNYVTSEGCLRRCTFCSEPRTSANTWYVRDVHQSVAVVEDLVRRSRAGGVKLHDPNFFHDPVRAGLFANLFAETVGLPWAASLHPADLAAMGDRQLRHLAAQGLCRVLVGLETPVPELVRLAGKRYDPAVIPVLAGRLAQAGIRGMFTFIVGWPDAPAEHYDQTIACAHQIRRVWDEHQCKIHFLEPWPGTPVHRLLVRRGGLASPQTLREWSRIDYYQAQYAALHDERYTTVVREANAVLSPYVEA